MRESGIILPVPEAEPIVQALRLDHDPSARLGVPAHITLLYPFAPPEVALGLGDDLARLFDRFGRFEFSLVDVGRFPIMWVPMCWKGSMRHCGRSCRFAVMPPRRG